MVSKYRERVNKFTFKQGLGLPVTEALNGRDYILCPDGMFRRIQVGRDPGKSTNLLLGSIVYDIRVFARLLTNYEKNLRKRKLEKIR